MDRRHFLHTGGTFLGASALGVPSWATYKKINSSPQTAIIMDAMGEIRNVYPRELLKEIIASGMNAVTVTLCDPKTYEQDAVDAAREGILEYDRYIKANPELLVKATSVADLDKAKKEGKLALFYLFQNSTPIGRNLDMVDVYYGLGVRSIQITYNYQNWAGAGCKERTGAGLTAFGWELVEKMNSTNMLIDLSHANMTTMADTIQASQSPVIVSHTGCMSVYKNTRNTTDENLKLLANKGGVVGICQIRPFITNIREGAFEHYLDHIQHAVNTAGIDHVGIGSDRDHRYVALTPEYVAELKSELGPDYPEQDFPLFMEKLNGPRRMEVIWEGLKKRGLSEDRIEKIMGKNVSPDLSRSDWIIKLPHDPSPGSDIFLVYNHNWVDLLGRF
jgi:membrane dipeptidase